MQDQSQYGEYTFLKNYLKGLGDIGNTIVDIGAKGVRGSNSYNLIKENRWNAILVEPEPGNYKGLIKEFIDNEGVIICNVAISDEESYMDFYVSEIQGHHSLVYKTNKTVKTIKVHTTTIVKLLDSLEVRKDFSILDVDAEGMDFIIIEDMLNNSEYRPHIIIHEKNAKCNFKSLLEKYEYYSIHETPGNIIWRKYEYR